MPATFCLGNCAHEYQMNLFLFLPKSFLCECMLLVTRFKVMRYFSAISTALKNSRNVKSFLSIRHSKLPSFPFRTPTMSSTKLHLTNCYTSTTIEFASYTSTVTCTKLGSTSCDFFTSFMCTFLSSAMFDAKFCRRLG